MSVRNKIQLQGLVIILAFLGLGCGAGNKTIVEVYERNSLADSSIIVSCLKCSCITDFLATHKLEKGVQIYADSNCLGKASFEYLHLDKKILDSLFLKNYNAVMFLKKGNTLRTRLLKTEEVGDFNKIVESFFM